MSGFRPDLMARAALTRIENDDPKRVEDIRDAMGNYAATMTKSQLVVVIGYLAKWVLKLEREAGR